MSSGSTAASWLYLMASTMVEMVLFYRFAGNLPFEGVIGLLASTNALLTIVVSMKLKDEPTALQYVLFIPIILLGILLLGMIFDYPLIS